MTTVLLVEDSKLISLANERLISKAGHNVIIAADGEDALTVARTRLPNVIVLDMMLPKLSGPEVLALLKADPNTAWIPVIALTCLSRLNEYRLRQDGAIAFIEKASMLAEPSVLLRWIATAIRISGKSAPSTRTEGADLESALPVPIPPMSGPLCGTR